MNCMILNCETFSLLRINLRMFAHCDHIINCTHLATSVINTCILKSFLFLFEVVLLQSSPKANWNSQYNK